MRISDWSSDVCSSDLFFVAAGDQVQAEAQAAERFLLALERRGFVGADVAEPNQCIEVARAEAAQRHPAQRVQVAQATGANLERSAERSVGKGWGSPCKSRWSPSPSQKHTKTKQ